MVLTGAVMRVGHRTGGMSSVQQEQDGFLPSCRSSADDNLLCCNLKYGQAARLVINRCAACLVLL